MKKIIILLITITMFTACDSSNVGGVYICTKIKYYSSQKTPAEITEKQKYLEENGLNQPIVITVYDNAIYLDFNKIGSDYSNGHHMEKRSNSEYYWHSEYVDNYATATFSGKELYIKNMNNDKGEVREFWAVKK